MKKSLLAVALLLGLASAGSASAAELSTVDVAMSKPLILASADTSLVQSVLDEDQSTVLDKAKKKKKKKKAKKSKKKNVGANDFGAGAGSTSQWDTAR
ncbi:MAG: hypothetical protein HQL95_05070 [Magnetococcales bacterium]|nr:hypothetical protein [Magnetococcales bacterium]